MLPYPLEARPDDGAARDRRRVLPAGCSSCLRRCSVVTVTLTGRAGRGRRPIPPRSTSCSLAERWGDGAPLLPADRRRDRGAARGDAVPGRPRASGVLPPQYGVATVELVAVERGDGRRASRPRSRSCSPRSKRCSVPEWNAFGLTTTTSSVFPMLIVNGPCRDALGIDYRAGCMGGAGGRGSMTIGRAVVAVPAQHRRPARGRDVAHRVRPAGALRALLRRVGGAVAVAVARASGAASRRPTDVVTVHGGKGTFPIADIHNDDPRDLLYLIAKSIAYPLANMFLGNAEQRRGRARDQPDVGRALRRRVPRRRRPARRSCTSTRGSRSTSGPSANRAILRDKGRVDADGPGAPRRAARRRSCRSCAAGSAACTRSRCRASARARCRAQPASGR